MHYETSVLKCPTGVYALVGIIPEYMSRLIFETKEIADLALAEAFEALEARHIRTSAPFFSIADAAPIERRPGSIHVKKVLVTAAMLEN